MTDYLQKSLFLIAITVLSCLLHEPAAAQSRLLQGQILDAQSGQPLRDVNLVFARLKGGTTSDTDGRFALRVPQTADTLYIRHIGYAPQASILGPGDQNISLTLLLQPAVLQAPEIQVQSDRQAERINSFVLRADEMRDVPDFAGEAYAIVKTLPGVSANNELSNQYSVQGGSPDENLVLLQSIALQRSPRIRKSYQENISPINPMLLEEIAFTSGGFSAEYGERLSSVLAARYRTASPKPLNAEVEAGLLNLGAMLEGQPAPNLYWAIAGRYANRGMILNTLQTSGDFAPEALDVQGSLNLQISSRHRLQLLALAGRNRFSSEPRRFLTQAQAGLFTFRQYATEFTGFERFSRKMGLLSARWQAQFTPDLSLQQTLGGGLIREDEDTNQSYETSTSLTNPLVPSFDSEQTLLSSGSIRRRDILDEKRLQYDAVLRWTPRPVVRYQAGFSWLRQRYDDDLDELEQEAPAIEDAREFPYIGFQREIASSTSAQFTTASVWGDVRLSTGTLAITMGLRASDYAPSGEILFKPRISADFRSGPFTRWTVAYGHYSQPNSYQQLINRQGRLFRNNRSQKARHLIYGVHHIREDGVEFKLQGFRKVLSDLIPYQVDDIFLRYEPEKRAEGNIYGASAYWKGPLTRRLLSWVSYTWLVGRQEIANEGGSWLPYDQRHALAAVIQDQMPKFPNSRAHLRILFGSGYPFTPVRTIRNGATGQRITIDGARNSLRLPAYRRVDAGYSYTLRKDQRAETRLTFEIFNIFDFRNQLSYAVIFSEIGRPDYAPINLSRRFFSGRVNVQF